MKCANCPANVDNPDSSIVNKYPDGLCKVGVNYKKKYGCQYTREQVDRWIAKRYPKPRTNQDALIERHKDVNLFAFDIAMDSWNDDQGFFYLPSGDIVSTREEAEHVVKEWLLSPAEDSPYTKEDEYNPLRAGEGAE